MGETPIARDFFAGQYAKIVEATFDTTQDFDLVDAAFVVGALTSYAFLPKGAPTPLMERVMQERGPKTKRILELNPIIPWSTRFGENTRQRATTPPSPP